VAKEPIFTRPFLLAFAASFAINVSFHSFVHFPGLLQQLHASETYIGAAVAALSLVGLLVRPAIGRAMDATGRRRVALFGAAVNVGACLLYLSIQQAPLFGVVPYEAWVFVVRGVHGVAEAALFSVLFTMAADLVPARRRTEGIALFGVSGMLPVSLGALLGDAILAHAGYAELFYACSGLAALGFVILVAMPETRPPDVDGAEPPGGFGAALRHPRLMPVWLVGVIFAIALTSYFAFLKTFALAQDDSFQVSHFFTPYAIVAVVLRLFFGWIPDRLGPKRTLFPAMGTLALGAVLLAYAEGPTPVAFAGVFCGLGHGYAFPIINSMVVTRAPAADRGSAVTLFTALFDAGALIGAPLLGLVADLQGHRPMFLTAAALTVIGLLAFAHLDRYGSRP